MQKLGLLAVCALLVVSSCGHTQLKNIPIDINDCVKHPSLSAGYQHRGMYNTTSLGLDLSLSSAANGKVFAEIEQFGSETVRDLHYAINPGKYRFNCYFDQLKPVHSAVFSVTGKTIPLPYPAISPVSLLDITPTIQHYEAWVAAQMPLLLSSARILLRNIKQQNIFAARQAWLKVHDIYETLGGVYNAFGNYNDEINGSSAGLPAGVHDAGFTGIHAVEYYLYASPQNSSRQWGKLKFLSKNLLNDINNLQKNLPNLPIDPIDMGIRAHEILENTIQFTLSGRDDYGAHATLDTIYANLQGTRQVIHYMEPVLMNRYAGLQYLNFQLDSAMREVKSMREIYEFSPVSTWPRQKRERMNAIIGSLTEELARIAAITDIRRH